MTYVLYAIEVDTGAEPPDDRELMTRCDERGEGSPLVYLDRETPESVIRGIQDMTNCYGDMRVVELTQSAMFPEPFWCHDCGVWGDGADHTGHLDRYGEVSHG